MMKIVMLSSALATLFVHAAPSNHEILLERFDNPVHTWREMNDPVMGGRSTGSVILEDGFLKFRGEVVNVPFLDAPGFIQARTTDSAAFPDVSQCSALQLLLRTNNTEYAGYRVSFGNAHAPHGKSFAYGYKANLKNVTGEVESGTIVIPFVDFTDFWDDATGDAIQTCHENAIFCPDTAALRNMKTMAFWSEGVAGKVSLEISSIYAVGCVSSIAPKRLSTTTDYSWIKHHVLRIWSQQLSLSTLVLRWF